MPSHEVLRRRRRRERLVRFLTFLCAGVSVVTTLGIVLVLFGESVAFFRHVPLWRFLSEREWTPLFEPAHYGIGPLLCGTFLVAGVAGILAIPTGLLGAVFLSEYATSGMRRFLQPLLEILAGIPTVVYGYFAISMVTPFLRQIYPELPIFNALSAGIVVGLMIFPTVCSLSEGALRAVPHEMREAGFALGASKGQVIRGVVIPGALSGVMSAFLLALGRAVGETMAVTLAAGATPRLTLNPLESIQTMSAYIVQVSLGDTPHGSVEYQTLFAVGATLFLVTLVMNMAALRLVQKFRQKYA